MYPRGEGGKSHTADVLPETLDDHFVPPQDEDRCLRGRVIDRGRRRVDGRVIMEKTESTATRPKRNRICRRSNYFHTPRMIRICLCHAEEVNKFVSSSPVIDQLSAIVSFGSLPLSDFIRSSTQIMNERERLDSSFSDFPFFSFLSHFLPLPSLCVRCCSGRKLLFALP